MIIIEKTNESFLKVFGEISVEYDIKEHFTFKAHNYRFHPKYKAGLWSGDISLYDIRTKRLPGGLFQRLVRFLEESGAEYQLIENDDYTPLNTVCEYTKEDVEEFINSLDLSLPRGATVRDYQIDAVWEAVRQKKVVLISPVSSGKSAIIYCIIRWILDKNPHAKIILMVPTQSLVNQMVSDFEEYSVDNGFDVAKYSQKLFTGHSKELTKQILVTTWQSLMGFANDSVKVRLLAEYDAVIGDEAHGIKATESQNILGACIRASYRIGTTGTLDNEKVHHLMIEGILGETYKVISTKELMDAGQVSNLKIKCLALKYAPEFCKAYHKSTDKKKKAKTYAEEMDFLVGLNDRNKFIAKIAAACSGATLILCNLVDKHIEPLYEMVKRVTDKPVYIVNGKISAEKREAIRKVANMEDCIIVASLKTMSTGVNIPNLRNIIFASPFKSVITTLQSIGRGLRLFEGKDEMVLIDIIDDIRHGKKENYAYQHAIERIAIYRKESFSVNVKEIPFLHDKINSLSV